MYACTYGRLFETGFIRSTLSKSGPKYSKILSKICCSIKMADGRLYCFMAAGILVRSSFWLSSNLPLQYENAEVKFRRIFCAVSSVSH